MPPILPQLARDLLDTLLDRYERHDRQTVVRVTLDTRKHAVYFDSNETRQVVNAALRALAENGTITIHYVKHQEHLIDKIDLNTSHASELYALLHRTPRANAEASLRHLLEAQPPHAEWHANFVAHCCEQLATHKSIAPLTLEDDDRNRALLATLAGLAQLTEPMLERVFSVRVLSDSKRFADLRGNVLRVLRKFSPHAEALGDDDHALLAAHFVERVPEYVQLAGALTLRVNRQICECAPFVPSLALPASLLRPAGIEACGAVQVLTIENATSFAEFCRVRPSWVLAVFTGGFASPTVIQLLQRLRDFRPELSIRHWGDLDVGGLRILRHLRQHLGEVRPVLMDATILGAYSGHIQLLDHTERMALETLRTDPLLADVKSLIEEHLKSGYKLEQEAIPVAQAVHVLNR